MILAKQIKSEGEKGKISVRSVRKESNEYLKKLSSEGVSEDTIKDGENEVQKITDQKINKIEEICIKFFKIGFTSIEAISDSFSFKTSGFIHT